MAGPPVVESRAVRKEFDGLVAVRDLELAIGAGEAYALVGPTGSGKSTVLRMLAALVEPTEGTVTVCGHDTVAERRAVHAKIGYLPDAFGLHDELRCWECLDYFADVHGVADREGAVADAISRAGLEAERDRFVGTMSRGMRQRLAFAGCTVHDPEVLILDEPASGLDPEGRARMMAELAELRERGRTVVISSGVRS